MRLFVSFCIIVVCVYCSCCIRAD